MNPTINDTQVGWLYDSTKQNLIKPRYDMLSIGDFDLFVSTLYAYIRFFMPDRSKYFDFYTNRIRRQFHLKIPMFEPDTIIDSYSFYHGTGNLKTIQNFQNLLHLYFGLFEPFQKERSILVGCIEYAYDPPPRPTRYHSVDGWDTVWQNLNWINSSQYFKNRGSDEFYLLMELRRQMENCDFDK